MSTAKDFVNKVAGTTAIDGGESLSAGIFRRTVAVTGFPFEADDNSQRQVLFKNTTGFNLRLVSAEYVPEAAVTADNTDYTTLDIAHQALPAGSLASPAAFQTTEITGTGDWVANTPVALTLGSEADKILSDGEYALVELDGTTGVGVDLPIGVWVLDYEVA